jgi:hypothetical protein
MALKDVFLHETTGNIVRMLGFSEPIAKQFTQMNQRADFALAKSFVLWVSATHQSADIKAYGRDENKFQYAFASWKREVGQDLAELLKTKPALEKKINVAKSHEEVLEILSSGMPEVDAASLLDLGQGWKWVELTDRHHSKEARLMQHCATDGRGELVSLRDPSGNPHVTMTFNKEQNTVFQIKGKQNAPPDEKYWDAVLAFFKQTQADVKDPFIRRKSLDLYNNIKKISGKDVAQSKEEVYERLAQALQSDAAKQWAWDIQPYTFDNADLEYDDAQEIEAKIDSVFHNVGYTSIQIEPVSGVTNAYHFAANWRKISTDPLDRIEEIPPFEEVNHSWQGLTVYRMAQEGIVNTKTAMSLKKFGQQNAEALNAVYTVFSELLSVEYGLNEAIGQDVDNDIEELEYEEFTGYEGSSGVKREVIEHQKLNQRWEDWRRDNRKNASAAFGQRYWENPRYQEIEEKIRAMVAAGQEPPEHDVYK